jgi:hypothetical protein
MPAGSTSIHRRADCRSDVARPKPLALRNASDAPTWTAGASHALR